MDQGTRNKLRNVVTQCRKLLEEAVSGQLEGRFGIYANPKKDEVVILEGAQMTNLSDEDQSYRKDLIAHYEHIQAFGPKPKDALGQLVREIAFTHLNRLCAYKMMEAREVYIGGQKFREAVSRGVNSNGVKFYLANHPEDERLFNTGHQEIAYRNFLDWLGSQLSEEIGVLFNPNDPANRLYPPQRVLDDVLALINDQDLDGIWSQDETIGWVYQYFTPKELRDQARKESQAPRNSYELAFRNQFFTPRYVVEFLTDNTLGRIWYEIRKGDTSLKEQCRYMVRRPTEIFLAEGEPAPKEAGEPREDLSQEELLKLPVYIPHRPKKDPRELKILDPACGSGHFLLYSFDLLLTIYEEAYDDPNLWSAFRADYPTLEEFKKAIPALVLKHNLYGIDIDLRCTQIAALALWLRCQRECQKMGLKKDRPPITKSNIVCAEPMPGEQTMLKEFVAQLEPKLLGQLVEVVFDKMKLAGEAGSLLRIEKEIRDAVKQARSEWVKSKAPKPGAFFFYEEKIFEEESFDFSGITDDQFFVQAEAKVLDALRIYAEKAHNSQQLQRQLFAEDTARGFAFVELCHKRFDVVLMNPPFGESIPAIRKIVTESFPLSSQDLGMVFVDRGNELLNLGGFIGAITSRTFLANDGTSEWRKDRLLGTSAGLVEFADLGYGVLDEAMVEAAAYVISNFTSKRLVIFHNLLASDHKGDDLLTTIAQNGPSSHRFVRFLRLFTEVPDYVLCYWLPPEFLKTCLRLPNIQDDDSAARVGLQTGDNHRFVRATWEVSPASIGLNGSWSFFAKGGEYEPFYDDIHLVVFWHDDGCVIKTFKDEKGKLLSRPQNLNYYHKEGITYPDRTTSDFSPRIMPKGIIFSSTGFALFPKDRSYLLGYLGATYTRPFKVLVEAFVGSGDTSVSGSAARHYRPGVLNVLPNLIRQPSQCACDNVKNCLHSRMKAFGLDETTRYFTSPFAIAPRSCSSLSYLAFKTKCEHLKEAIDIIYSSAELEKEVLQSLGEEDLRPLFDDLYGKHPADYSDDISFQKRELACEYLKWDELALVEKAKQVLGASRQIIKKSYFSDRRLEIVSHILSTSPKVIVDSFCQDGNATEAEKTDLTHRIMSYSIGVVYGRWDVRLSTDNYHSSYISDPFASLPVCPPGMLQGSDGLPATETPAGYALRIDWDGILVDDPGHSDDIIRRVRDVLEVIWKDRAEAIEKEACEILNIKDLRDYFRKPSKGGFWDDHISRYSKSRRKAPIYWLLQSSKKNYALWIYYHRLDKDIIFKALLNYVEPKIRLEENRLDSLRSQRSGSGDPGKTNKKLDKEIEKQEDFLSELRDFEDKLRRSANLQLDHDLNDGVVLNIAPLHELVPWKEAKDYWEELLKDKYEWSSIGKQMREKGLVK